MCGMGLGWWKPSVAWQAMLVSPRRRASGHVRRVNRPNTRLLLTMSKSQIRTCKKGAIHTGQSDIRCLAKVFNRRLIICRTGDFSKEGPIGPSLSFGCQLDGYPLIQLFTVSMLSLTHSSATSRGSILSPLILRIQPLIASGSSLIRLSILATAGLRFSSDFE